MKHNIPNYSKCKKWKYLNWKANIVRLDFKKKDKKVSLNNRLLETSLTTKIQSKRVGRKYHENTSLEKFGLSVIISDKVGFSKNNMTRDIVRCFIMTEGSIHPKDTIILHPSPRSSKCRKQKLTEQKGEIDKSTDCLL